MLNILTNSEVSLFAFLSNGLSSNLAEDYNFYFVKFAYKEQGNKIPLQLWPSWR